MLEVRNDVLVDESWRAAFKDCFIELLKNAWRR